jgi:hypothetical protein
MFLLIDNCSLLRLTHADAYSHFLINLTNYIKGGHIRVITHKLILEEWEKHKSLDKDRKIKKLGKVHGTGPKGGELLPSFISTEHIDHQQTMIDKLLEDAIVVDTPEVINLEFAQRYRKKLAPFHNNKDSQNDWEIFGSVAQYCIANGLPNLHFVSSNDLEFADPADKLLSLHPELIDRFRPLTVHYFNEWKDFLQSMGSLVLPKQLLSLNIVRNERFSHKASMRKHMLDSLYMLFKNTYAEARFVPTHLLIRYFPFKRKDTDHNHYSVFSLHGVPDELVNMFKAIRFENSNLIIVDENIFTGVTEVTEKLQFVLRRLTNNLIFRFTGKNSSNDVEIRFENKVYCNCINCSFQRMEWQHCLTLLRTDDADPQQQLDKAFIYYQFGNYDAATELYLSIRDEFKAKKQYIWYFICQYNLRHLSFLLSGIFYTSKYSAEEITKLKEIDPIEDSVKLKSYTDYDLVSYISDGSYFRIAVESIGELVTKIEDHYYSFINGGWSSNSHIQLLICEYAELETFTRGNGLIYDVYSNWQRLTSNFIKGLFASHAMRDTENSALDTFDDYLLTMMITYAETESITKYFYRYKLKDLSYEQSSSEADFITIAFNLLAQYSSTTQLVLGGQDPNTKFLSKLQRMIANMITIVSLLEDTSYDANAFAKRLLHFFKHKTYHRNHDTPLDLLMARKGRLFNGQVLRSYVSFLVENLKVIGPRPLIALVKRNKKAKFEGKQLDRILLFVFKGASGEERDEHYELLSATYKQVSIADKGKIEAAIQVELAENFNFDLYYRSVIHGLLQFELNVFNEQLDKLNVSIKDYTMRSISTGEPSQFFPRLDELLNIGFKFDVVFAEKAIRKLKKAGPYYHWLIDMDRFNHTKFKFEWLNHYPTDFYLRQMSKSEKLRQRIIEFLKKENDALVEKILIRMTYFTER